MSRAIIVLISLFILEVPLLSQPDTMIVVPHGCQESSFSVNIGGPTYALSIAIGEYLSDRVECEVGLGLIGVYGGLRHHLLYRKVGREREYISPYTGLFCSYGMLIDSTSNYDYLPPWSTTSALYLPLGVRYHGQAHFHFAAEIAAVKLLYHQDRFERDLFLWPCLRFGWYF